MMTKIEVSDLLMGGDWDGANWGRGWRGWRGLKICDFVGGGDKEGGHAGAVPDGGVSSTRVAKMLATVESAHDGMLVSASVHFFLTHLLLRFNVCL
jgi:hypothetical protein